MTDSDAKASAGTRQAGSQPVVAVDDSKGVIAATQCTALHEVPTNGRSVGSSASANTIPSLPTIAQSDLVPFSAKKPLKTPQPPLPWSSSPEQPPDQSPAAPSPPLNPDGPPSLAAVKGCHREAAQLPQPRTIRPDASSAEKSAPAAPAEPAAAGAQTNAAPQHGGLFAPRNATAADPWLMASTQSEAQPAAPRAVPDVPRSTTPAQDEEQAAEAAGLALANPPRRVVKDLYPAWRGGAHRLGVQDPAKARPDDLSPS